MRIGTEVVLWAGFRPYRAGKAEKLIIFVPGCAGLDEYAGNILFDSEWRKNVWRGKTGEFCTPFASELIERLIPGYCNA